VASIPTAEEVREIVRDELRVAFDALDGRVEPYLNSEQAAVFLGGTTAQSIRWLVSHRELPHRRAQGERRGRLLFKTSELQRWVEEHAWRVPRDGTLPG
jgi:hypothetical protein